MATVNNKFALTPDELASMQSMTKITKEAPKSRSKYAPTEDELSSLEMMSEMANVNPTPPQDSYLKQAARTIYQPVGGFLSKFTYPADVAQIMGQGEALSEYDQLQERLPELQRQFPNAPWENFTGLDREKYMQAVQSASETFPTQHNIEQGIENLTGLPLTPQTDVEKALRLSGTAAAFRPGAVSDKITAAVVAPTVKTGLQLAGVPEPISDIAGLATSSVTPTVQSISKVTKPSGLATQRFENLKEPIRVSSRTIEKINDSAERDFRKISDKLFSESSPTYLEVKKGGEYRKALEEGFDKVDELAKEIPGTFKSNDIKNIHLNKMNAREEVGISPSEYEREYLKESRKISKGIPSNKYFNATDAVKQFRKNNSELSQLYEPGKSKSFNRAKADALLSYNEALAEVIEQKYPNSEFSNLFKKQNQRWSDLKNVESVNESIDSLFDGKLDFKAAQKILETKRLQLPFKKVLGKDNYKEFEGLLGDFLSKKESYSLIKKAEASGFNEFVKFMKTGGLTLLNPKLGAIKAGADGIKMVKNAILDKPQYIVKWRNSIKDLKNGKFKSAEELIKELETE